LIFNRAGKPVGRFQLEHKQIFPKLGWVEHNPTEIWEPDFKSDVTTKLFSQWKKAVGRTLDWGD
jgi:glycerol kinase